MSVYQDSITRSLAEKIGEAPSVLDFGGDRDGTTDNATAFQDAIDSVLQKGGGYLFVPRGDYNFEGQIELKAGVVLVGEGYTSVLIRGATMGSGNALVKVTGDNSGILDLAIDGQTTTPVVLKYSEFSTDPMDADLTTESSVYIAPGTSSVLIRGVTIFHTGGYAILIDADTDDVRNVSILDCYFTQNRPHIFETEDDMYEFGSWTGGVFYRGDCRTSQAKPYAVHDLTVRGCKFYRCTGNCVWGHSWGFDVQHTGIVVEGNTFEAIGRDPILFGNVYGGSCSGNVIKIINVLTETDIDSPAEVTGGDKSVGIDSSGYVSDVHYVGNSITNSPGAEAIDLDGFRDGSVANNVVDDVYIGINMGDAQSNGAGHNVSITGNKFSGCSYGTIRLNDATNCVVSGNFIEAPAGATETPIQINAVAAAGCSGNKITGNRITWTDSSHCVSEVVVGSGTYTSSTINHVYANEISGSNYGEFCKHADSGSSTAYYISTEDNTATYRSESWLRRVGFGDTSALRMATFVNSTQTEIAQLQDKNRMLLVGIDAGEGAIATGDRSALIWGDSSDAVATGKIYADGFLAMVGVGETDPGYDSTFLDADADLIETAEVGLLRYNATEARWEQSVAVDAGPPITRIWTTLAGATTPAGSDTQVQFNDGGAMGADSLLTWDKTNKLLTAGRALVYDSRAGASPEGITYLDVRAGANQSTNSLMEFRSAADGLLSCIESTGAPLVPWIKTNGALGSSSTTYGSFDELAVRFIQDSGDSSLAGSIQYRAHDLNDSLEIYGAGSGTNNRIIRMYDKVIISGVNGVACLTLSDGYVDAADGFYTADAGSNSIQAPNGTVTGLRVSADSYMQLIEHASPGLSTAGNARFYMDSTTHKIYVSVNAGAFAELGTSGSVGGTDGCVQYNNGGVFGGDANLSWDDTNKKLVAVTTLNSLPAISVTTGYIEAAGGFNTSGTAWNAIQAPSGGVTGEWVTATDYHQWIQVGSNPGASTAGNTRLYMATDGTMMISINGAAATNLMGGRISGLTSGRIPFAASSSSLDDDAGIAWDDSGKKIILISTSNSVPALSVTTGYVEAAGGFTTTGTATNSIQASLGGVTAKWLVSTVSINSTEVTQATAGSSTAGNMRLIMDSADHLPKISYNGGAYVGLVGSMTAVYGTTNEVEVYMPGDGTAFIGLPDAVTIGRITLNQTTGNLITFSGTMTAGRYISGTNFYVEYTGNVAANGQISAVGPLASTGSSGGVNVSAQTAWNSVQSIGGIRTGPGGSSTQGKIYVNFSASFNNDVGEYGRAVSGMNGLHVQNQVGQAAFVADEYTSGSEVAAVIGRRARGTIALPSGVVDTDNLLTFGGRGWQSSATDFPSALNAAINFQAAGTFTLSSTPTRITFETTSDGSTTRATRLQIQPTGVIQIAGRSGDVAVQLDDGYYYSDEGYYSPNVSDSTVNLPFGGVSAVKVISKQAIYLEDRASPGPNNPGTGYGGLGHKTGSTYWYWNGSAWAEYNFASSVSAITSINSQAGPAIAVNGTTNQVTVTTTSNTLTLSLPQNIHTAADVSFNSLYCARLIDPAINCPGASIQAKGFSSLYEYAWNAIQATDGGIAASTSYGFSLIGPYPTYTQYAAIDYSGSGARFVGLGGVNCGQYGGIAGAGFNPNVGGVQYYGVASGSGGGDVFSFTATVLGLGSRTISLRFTNGALTYYSAA